MDNLPILLHYCEYQVVFCLSVDKEKLTAGTQTEPIPTRIDRMPLDMPPESRATVAADYVHSVVDPSATEVPLQNW